MNGNGNGNVSGNSDDGGGEKYFYEHLIKCYVL